MSVDLTNGCVLVTGASSGIDPLAPDDVAEAVLFCATRPANANVREMILMAGAQASAVHAHGVDQG